MFENTLILGFFFLISLSFTYCDDLQYYEKTLDSPVDNILWCGSSKVVTEDDELIDVEVSSNYKKKIFVLTDKGRVYKSGNNGKDWEDVYDTLQSKFSMGSNATINTIQISPADSRIIYFFTNTDKSFYSNNCGKDYKSFSHDKGFNDFRLNKMNKNYMLVHKSQDCGKFNKNCQDDDREIYITKDFGLSWVKMLDKVQEASWDKLLHWSEVPDTRIIAAHRSRENGKWKQLVSFSDDLFQTKTVISEDAYSYFQTDSYLFLLTKKEQSDENEGSYNMKIASSWSNNYYAQDLKLPIKRAQDNSFTILDTSEGQIFVSINHQGDESKMTNVYMSDYRGFQFSLSLMYNVRDSQGNADFEKIMGNEGVYIANIFDHNEVEKHKQKKVEKSMETKKTSSKSSSIDNINYYKKTVISYDKGGNWHSIKAPQVDYDGNEISCSGECSLHLKGRTENNGNPIYSSENAPGILMATGGYGLNLPLMQDDINTYLSRDGGHNWYEIQQSSHIYEIGDHGGVIVTADDTTQTKQIHYSWDEGLTWEEKNIASTPFEVSNIITEPTNMEQQFFIYGVVRDKKAKTPRGVIIALDFQSMHQRVCSGSWDPGAEDSDYEYWIPTNYQGDKCVFGRKVKYIRRKRESKCFNSNEFDQKLYVEQCPCTDEDFECDFGFYPDEDTGKCEPISDEYKDAMEHPEIPDPCWWQYEISTGYKKIVGDYCHGGVDLGPIYKDCPKEEEKKEIEQQTINKIESQPQAAGFATNVNTDATPTQGIQSQIQARPNENQSNNNNLIYLIVIVLIIVAYKFKDNIIELIGNYKEKLSRQGEQSVLPQNSGNYEAVGSNELHGMLDNDDDDEEI